MFLDSLPKFRSTKEGLYNDGDRFNYYLGVARVVGYDPILKKANLQWLDGFGGGTSGVPALDIGSNGTSFFGLGLSRGDIVLVSRGRGNFGGGHPYIVGRLSSATQANRINAFHYDTFEKEYIFTYTRSPESGDPYLKSSKGSELHLSQDIFLGGSEFSSYEVISSQDITYNTSRAFSFYGSGVWGNIGMIHVPMAFQKSGDEGDVRSLHKNEYDREATKDIGSAIKPVILEDGSYLFCVTDEDSKNSIDDDDAKPYTELDFVLSEQFDPEPIALGSVDLINEDFLDKEKEGGLFARFGVGTKVGKEPNQKEQYARPLRRRIYKDDTEDKLEFETDKDKLQEGITTKDDNEKFGTSFWFNIFQSKKLVGFIEVLKTGALKIFSGLKQGESGNSLELDIKGRIKSSVGDFEDYEPEIKECSDDKFPQLKKSPKDESIIGFVRNGINIFLQKADGNDTAFQLFSEEGAGRVRLGGDLHFHVEGKERRYVKEDGASTYNGNFLLRTSKNFVGKAKGAFGIQGTPISLALKPATFEDSCSGGTSSASGTNVITLGLGSDMSDEGGLTGGTQVKGTIDNLTKPTKLTIDLDSFNEILVKNFNKIIFDGKVDIGTSGLNPVGVKGSISTYSGIPHEHSNHELSQLLSSSLRASGGSSSGASGDSGVKPYPGVY